ncbi:MAG: DUF4364 family protein [Tissierellaceae bacterium]|nr:DUF4364 family protein [Tissierellaceae bacterium]
MFIENTEELAQNKLLLLYIIKSGSFNNAELGEFVLKKNYMDYFSIQQYLSELIDSNFIIKTNIEGKEIYSLLEKGNMTLSYFQDRIPPSVKEELTIEFGKFQRKKELEAQIIAEYFPKENGQFIINLKLVENDETLFSIYFDVASKEQADLICTSWKTNTDAIYKGIMDVLISNI